MRLIFILRLSLINTFKKKFRALLAIGGIALTVAVMVTLFGVDMGLHSLVEKEIKNNEHQDVITVTSRGDQQVKFNEENLSKIRSISGVGQVSLSAGLLGLAAFNSSNLTSPIYAVSENYFSLGLTNSAQGSVKGLPVNDGAVVSTKVLKVFGIPANEAIGKTFTLSATINHGSVNGQARDDVQTIPEKYTIKAVVDRGDRPVVFVSLEKMKLHGLTTVDVLKVRVSNPDKVAEVRETIERKGFETASVLDMIEQANRLFDVIRNVLYVFGAVVFAVTISATFTIISLTLMQETRLIGFLRINGFLNRDVKLLFLLESITLNVMGALLGVVIGIIAGSVLNQLSKNIAQQESFTSEVSIFTIPVVYVILMLMISVGIGWLFGLIPAKRAVLIQPLEELNG